MVLLCLAALLAPLLATNEHSATTLSDHRLATSIATDVVASFELDTFASGLFIPTDIAFTSSGVAFVTEKHGMLKVIQNGTTSVFADLRTRVNDDGDRGLLGVAVHPDFHDGEPWVYVTYTHDPAQASGNGAGGRDGDGLRVARVERFRATIGATVTYSGTSEVILGAAGTWTTAGAPTQTAAQTTTWACGDDGEFVDDCLPADTDVHTIGNLDFGPDGMLYVGNGEAGRFDAIDARSMRAVDVDSLAGKILRVDPATGLGVSSNPHWTGDGDDNASRVWYSGLRNPYRFAVAPDGAVWVADVGGGEWEEVDSGPAGSDFGWPCYEGGAAGTKAQTPGFRTTAACISYYATDTSLGPVWSYDHENGSKAIIGGDIVTSTDWPAAYQGSYLVMDFLETWLQALTIEQPQVQPLPLATQVTAVSAKFGPDGALHLVDITTGVIERITPIPSPDPPGRLRVTTAPASPTKVYVNGLERSDWGLDWLEVPSGVAHEVCFSDNPNGVTPECRLVTVPSGGVGTTVGVYHSLATLVVTTRNDLGQLGVESVISVDGTPAAEWGLVSTRPAGPTTVCFGPAADHLPPPCSTVTLTAGATTTVDGVFTFVPGSPGITEPVGRLRVEVTPAVPTTVTVDGALVREWGLDWVPMSPGTYEVCFSDVPGHVTPPCETVTITAGAVTTVQAAAPALGTLRVVTSPPTDVPITVNGVARNQWGLWTFIDSGVHVVCAETAPNPVCRTVVVNGGATSVVTIEL